MSTFRYYRLVNFTSSSRKPPPISSITLLIINIVNVSDYHPEFFPEHDKKSLSLQPDLTQTVPPCYEYPYTTPATSVTRSVSEHHYDVPHLASGSDIQMSPATSSTLESSSGKRSQLSGFTNNCMSV